MKPTIRSSPIYRELAARYAGHPAAAVSLWGSSALAGSNVSNFRAHSPYVFQNRHNLATFRRSYAELNKRYPELMASAVEDGAFGARCEIVSGRMVSRDLLDSVAEIGFLESVVGDLSRIPILDIGAGYGRLGHRIEELVPNCGAIRCVDGVPESSVLCDYYLGFRECEQASMVPLDEVEQSLSTSPAAVALNVHSFPEMPLSAIEWWIRLLCEHDVRFLFVVPNEVDDLRSTEPNGSRLSFEPLLSKYGFSLERAQTKYGHASNCSNRPFLYQDMHMIFVRGHP